MKLILIAVVALAVIATLGCGNKADDPFLKEMADWFIDNRFELPYSPGRPAAPPYESRKQSVRLQEKAIQTLPHRLNHPSVKYHFEYQILREILQLRFDTLEHLESFQAEETQRAEALGHDVDYWMNCKGASSTFGHTDDANYFEVSIQFYRTCQTDMRLYDLFERIKKHWVEDILEAGLFGEDPYGMRTR